MGRRKPKRLKTGDKPDEEVVIVKVRVKVESDNDKDKESSDNDANEEEEQEQAAQPVAQVERPAYVAPRLDCILMDYNKRMGDVVIPDNKVIRLMNCWCYMNPDRVHWEENSIDRCPTYGVCQVCCGSGPTGGHCVICGVNDVLYVYVC
jgi:hypothetical protein